MKPNSSNPEHRTSSLLSREENETVIKLVGNRCQTLSTTVIQLFSADGPSFNEWHKRYFGVLCLIKDNPRRSYFLRLFCLSRRQLVWEQELYMGMNYSAPQNFFHTFEADDYIAAFNFANEDEAAHMRHIVLEKLRRLEKRQYRHSSLNNEGRTPQQPSSRVNGTATPPYSYQVHSGTGMRKKDNSGKRKNSKLTKADISDPQDFRHVVHVGFDPVRGFDAKDIKNSPELDDFFKKAGVSVEQLRDPGTREFIYDFLEKNGGLNAFKEEEEKCVQPPPVPARITPAHPPITTRPAPRLPPSSVAHASPPSRHMPPPVPSLDTLPRRPQEPSSSSLNIPPPPPTPPPMNIPPPPPMAPPSFTNGGASSSSSTSNPGGVDHGALFNEIRDKPKLKPVDQEAKSKTLPGGAPQDLLSEIQQGVELRPVKDRILKEKPNGLSLEAPTSMLDLVAAALRQKLSEQKFLYSSEEESHSEEDEEDSEFDEE